jgi:hypothetical protein
MKWLYKPLGLVVSVLGGLIATKLFSRLWRLLAGQEDEAPDSHDRNATWKQVAFAATIQGAVFGGVKAIVDRAGARTFEKATGTWPD